MKKRLSALITVAIVAFFVVLALASIGDDSDSSNNGPTNDGTTQSPSSNSGSNDITVSPSPEAPQIDVPEGGIILFDESDMIVTVTGIERTRDGYVKNIQFLIENNGSDERAIETLNNNFITKVVRINNFSIQAGISATVASGKAARETMSIDNKDAELFNIKDIFEISMQFETYTPDNFNRVNNIVHELSTISIASNNFSSFNNGTLAFSNDYVEIYSCDFSSGLLSSSMVIVVKNISNNDAHFRLENISVNGIMNSSSIGNGGNIFNETYRIFRIMLDDDVDTRDINEIEFKLELGDFNDIVSFNTKDIGIVTITY